MTKGPPKGPHETTARKSDQSLTGVAGWDLWRAREQFIADLDEHLAALDAVRVVDLDDYRRRKHAVESGSMWGAS